MPCPGVGPCGPYDLDLSCCLISGSVPDPCLGDGTPVPQEIIDTSILAASQLLYALTGRQFGCCTVTLRPCRSKCAMDCCLPEGFDQYPWMPFHNSDGTWTNISCKCKGSCSCVDLCEIDLPYPVCSIDEVKVDGVVLGANLYRVDDFKRLVRVGTSPFGSVMQCTNMQTALGPVGGPIVSGEVSVTGPGATPTIPGVFFYPGVLMPTDGSIYTVALGPTLDTLRQDLMIELELPVGCIGSVTVGGIAGGGFEVDSVQGGATLAIVPLSGGEITFTNVTEQNTPNVIRVRAPASGFTGPQIQIIPNTTCGQGVNLLKVCWVSPTQAEPCEVTPTLRRISGAPNQGAICNVIPAPTSFTSTLVGQCYEGQGDLNFGLTKTLSFNIQDGTNPSAGLNQFTLEAPEHDDPGNLYFWPLHPTPYGVGDVIESHTSPDGSFARLTVTSIVGTGPSVTIEAGVDVPVGSQVGFTAEFFCQVPVTSVCWPECNDLTKPDTEPGTWSVTVTYGRPVPELVKLAAAQFACELIKACLGRDCKLPQRVSSISRQGVSVSFLDPMSFLGEGLTGIYLVDLAARTYNPHRLMRRAVVTSPDVLNNWRVTDTGSGPSNC